MAKVLSLTPSKTPLITPAELLHQLPVSDEELQFIESSRQTIRNILDGIDPRLLLIIGPCSIHDLKAAKEYAEKLYAFGKAIEKSFFVVMRVYFEKPRTSLGWKGLLYDPHLDGSNDINTGILWTRKLLLDLTRMGIPIASEFLDPISPHYFDDLIAWGCIGARTSSSQIHRQMAANLPMPVAFKNSTDGNIDTAINGILAAQAPHSFLGVDEQGTLAILHAQGNAYGHLVLRGGEQKPNYDVESIAYALNRLKKFSLPQRLVVDCSHDNSMRDHERQNEVFENILQQWANGNNAIRGIILESHLYEGNQQLHDNPNDLKYAVSLTDPCLDWEATRKLVLWGYDHIKQARSSRLEAKFV